MDVNIISISTTNQLYSVALEQFDFARKYTYDICYGSTPIEACEIVSVLWGEE